MKERSLIFTLMLLTVPIAGEFRIYPFHDDFRVSLGTPIFFFFLLWLRKVSPFYSGLFTGLSVLVFRILLETLFTGFNFSTALIENLPASFYYVIYGAFFTAFRVTKFVNRPLIIGMWGACIEVLASLVEIISRHLFSSMTIPWGLLSELAPIAIIRSFFVLGFYSIFMMREAQLIEEQQRKRIESMLVDISNLFAETIQLKKTMRNSEYATRECYGLYRHLAKSKLIESRNLAQTALKVAGEIHEIKKDNQRIFAGLSKIISDKSITDYMDIQTLGLAIQKTNFRYARLMGKKINIEVTINQEHPQYHTYTVFSILNNLVSNAVESIVEEGNITISITRNDQTIEFIVCDDGPGLPEKIEKMIFEPGFTTKYDLSGRPSTGMGLSYVKDITENLGGKITLSRNSTLSITCFHVYLPIDTLTKKDD